MAIFLEPIQEQNTRRLQDLRTCGFLVLLKLGGGFKYVLFSPLFGEDSHFD